MTSHRIGLETLKLLVEVAWADHEVAPEEAAYIEALAGQVGASAEEVDELRRCLADELRLPAPDIALLREHSADAVRAARDLITVDRRIVDDERAVLERIRRLLG